MRLPKLLYIIVMSSILSIIMFTSSVAASSPFDIACQGGNGTAAGTTANGSPACSGQVNNPISGSGGVFERVINLLTLVTGIIAIIVIIVSGIRFTTSSGDPNSLTQARNTILYTVIGLVVLLLARSIIVFVINRL